MNKKEQTLNRLIELYFEGMTSLRQERRLRRMLADPGLRSAEADEARAVLGASLMTPYTARAKHLLPAILWRTAAVLLITVSATAIYLGVNHTDDVARSDCYAYVGTEVIHDQNQIMDMVRHQLADVSAAADQAGIDLENSLETFKHTQP